MDNYFMVSSITSFQSNLVCSLPIPLPLSFSLGSPWHSAKKAKENPAKANQIYFIFETILGKSFVSFRFDGAFNSFLARANQWLNWSIAVAAVESNGICLLLLSLSTKLLLVAANTFNIK